MFGPRAESPLLAGLETRQAKEFFRQALLKSTVLDASLWLKMWLGGLKTSPGLRNSGLFDDSKLFSARRAISGQDADATTEPDLFSLRETGLFETLGNARWSSTTKPMCCSPKVNPVL